jgi:hypothetical protein
MKYAATGWSLVQMSPTVCLYVCDQETRKGPSCPISACEWMKYAAQFISYENDRIFILFTL